MGRLVCVGRLGGNLHYRQRDGVCVGRLGGNLHYRQRDGVCVALTFTTVNGMVFVWR